MIATRKSCTWPRSQWNLLFSCLFAFEFSILSCNKHANYYDARTGLGITNPSTKGSVCNKWNLIYSWFLKILFCVHRVLSLASYIKQDGNHSFRSAAEFRSLGSGSWPLNVWMHLREPGHQSLSGCYVTESATSSWNPLFQKSSPLNLKNHHRCLRRCPKDVKH